MKLLSRKGDDVTYEAHFWEGPLSPGETGRRVKRKVRDRIVPRYRTERVDGVWTRRLVGHGLAGTARSVSYYTGLEKALGIKWGDA